MISRCIHLTLLKSLFTKFCHFQKGTNLPADGRIKRTDRSQTGGDAGAHRLHEYTAGAGEIAGQDGLRTAHTLINSALLWKRSPPLTAVIDYRDQ